MIDATMELLPGSRPETAVFGDLGEYLSASKIIVMDAGRVVEEGTHRSLIRKPDGVYARFYSLQGSPAPALLDGPDDEVPEIAMGAE